MTEYQLISNFNLFLNTEAAYSFGSVIPSKLSSFVLAKALSKKWEQKNQSSVIKYSSFLVLCIKVFKLWLILIKKFISWKKPSQVSKKQKNNWIDTFR